MTRALLCATATIVLLAGCDSPVPEPGQPLEPQAAAAEQSTRASELSEAIQAPLDKARAVEAQTLEAAEDQRAAIEAATGG